MNSTLKPVLSQAGVPPSSGQASPAKANVAGVNHAAAHPQGAQNSLHHAPNSLVGQNLTHHAPAAPQIPAHAIPSMAPVSANMAQMAQNMSHHGNLSHVGQNSVAPPNPVVSPSKAPGAPLSLVQDKLPVGQPLALTRTPDKKDAEPASQANGTVESPKAAANAPAPPTLKLQNAEPSNDKPDIARTSPSTTKPSEKAPPAPTTPQKVETASAVAVAAGQVAGPSEPKLATANEPPEKSPSKPVESKPTPTADVAPTQTDTKPTPECANDSQIIDKPVVNKPEASTTEPKTESAKVDDKIEEKEPEKPNQKSEKAVEKVESNDKVDGPKKEEQKPEPLEKVEEKEVPEVPKIPVSKPEPKPAPKSTMKLATVTTPMRRKRRSSPTKGSDGPSPAKKFADLDASTRDTRGKRNRIKVQLYQSPTPELTMATKLSASVGRSTPTKPNDDKLIVFYKNEYLAVRNAEGGFYVCQTMQNVYRSTRKIKIRWLSQDKADPSGETYKPDFYDVTDMECVLTTLSLSRLSGGAQQLRAEEAGRARSILDRALQAERGGQPVQPIQLTEEHPDGLDLSLYTDESQLEKKSRKRGSPKTSPRNKNPAAVVAAPIAKESPPPSKRARPSPRQSPKSGRKARAAQVQAQAQAPAPSPNKRRAAGSTPTVAPSSKTATALTEKSTPPVKAAKSVPAKKTPTKPSKVETPAKTPKGRAKRLSREVKASPVVPTPSTSTGKTTRTPRKPPAKK